MSFYSPTALIVEDSKAVALMLQQYLKKIGFTQIFVEETGKSGIRKFHDLIESKKIPLVFLDFDLPDMSAAEVAPELFSKTPEVKIILETAHDKTDDSVRNLFALGVSHFISKPLRFDNLKEVVNTVKTEFELDESVGMETDFDKIKDHLIVAHRASVTRIAQTCGFPADQVLSFLRGLVSQGDALEMNSIKEILCNKFNSVNISQIFSCPKCTCSNFEQTKLIEHYDCGAIELENAFVDEKCPQCHKEIKALGVDYRVMPNLFVCNDCEEKFPEPTVDLNCIRCGSKFSLTEANWIQSPTFMWMKESIEEAPVEEVSNEEILKVISESS